MEKIFFCSQTYDEAFFVSKSQKAQKMCLSYNYQISHTLTN